jgi:hypothetical protein
MAEGGGRGIATGARGGCPAGCRTGQAGCLFHPRGPVGRMFVAVPGRGLSWLRGGEQKLCAGSGMTILA